MANISSATGGGSGAILVPAGSMWSYLDTGSNSGTAWRTLAFDDTLWSSGAAPLGYDFDVAPATTVSFGEDEANKYITTWFRHSFVVTNAANCQRLLLRVLRDDGVVVYLNGIEILRDNMPPGEISSATLAAVGLEEGLVYHATNFAFPLREGTNVLAAEVHQWDPTSSDLLFDLELGCTLLRGPYLQMGTTSSMVVRWRTAGPVDSVVLCGTNANELNAAFGDAAQTNDHHVVLTNLLPNTRYFYSVGKSGEILASGPDLAFLTAPEHNKPIRIWAIGDCGAVNFGLPWARMVRDAYYQYTGSRQTDVWLMLGDNAYTDGTDWEYQTAVFAIYQKLLSSTPMMSTIGNHETYEATPDAHFSYFDIFSPPTAGEAGGLPSGTKRYYSFNYGNVHFVCLDSMLSDRSSNGVMCTWLKQDLEANTNDWLIAFWHHPPYSRGNHDSDNPFGADPELAEMRENAVPILEAYGVDLILSGHSHSYERSHLLDGHYGSSTSLLPNMIKDSGGGRPEDTGAYLKSGSGPAPHQGAVYVVAGSSSSTTGGHLNHPAMFISLNQLGSLVIDVDQNRLDARFLRETGVIDDSFTILKDALAEPLRIVSFLLSNSTITAIWKSEAGSTYRVEKTRSLENPAWTPASEPIAASGATTFWFGEADPEDSRCFYRIVGNWSGP